MLLLFRLIGLLPHKDQLHTHLHLLQGHRAPYLLSNTTKWVLLGVGLVA